MFSITLFKKYIFLIFIKNIFKVGIVFFAFGIILNLFEEISFFKDHDVGILFPFTMSMLKVPSMLYDIFPFIFLISSILLFLFLIESEEINLIKLTGISNFKIIMFPAILSLLCGMIIIFGLSIVTSKLTRTYLNIKNNYTLDNDYLAAITENGIWIKDVSNKKNLIINASRINENFLENVSIFQFEENFNYVSRLESKKIDISSKDWKVYDAKLIFKNNKIINYKEISIESNFDLNELKNIFSEITSVSFWDLKKLQKNYKELGISTMELKSEFHKGLSYPIFLMCMTILAGITILSLQTKKSYIFYIFLSIILSVIIYYLNYFSKALGDTNNLNIIASIWSPIILLTIFCSIGLIGINEK